MWRVTGEHTWQLIIINGTPRWSGAFWKLPRTKGICQPNAKAIIAASFYPPPPPHPPHTNSIWLIQWTKRRVAFDKFQCWNLWFFQVVLKLMDRVLWFVYINTYWISKEVYQKYVHMYTKLFRAVINLLEKYILYLELIEICTEMPFLMDEKIFDAKHWLNQSKGSGFKPLPKSTSH